MKLSKKFFLALLAGSLIFSSQAASNREVAKAVLIDTQITVAVIASMALLQNCFVKEDHFVSYKYPYAQQWYDSLNEKYPDAHLSEKRFLQTMYGMPVKLMSWCSTMNAIYFPQDSLKAINAAYKRKSEGQELSKEESEMLAQEEFILLHEAGHIEQNHIVKRLCIGLSFDALITAVVKKYDINLSWFNRLFLRIAVQSPFTRFQEGQADDFACARAGQQELEGGIRFFENEEMDPLFNIENKKIVPFVETKSIVLKGLHKVALVFEWLKLKQKQAIKKSPLRRWIHDYMNGPTHPSPSSRAQKIRNAIEVKQKASLV